MGKILRQSKAISSNQNFPIFPLSEIPSAKCHFFTYRYSFVATLPSSKRDKFHWRPNLSMAQCKVACAAGDPVRYLEFSFLRDLFIFCFHYFRSTPTPFLLSFNNLFVLTIDSHSHSPFLLRILATSLPPLPLPLLSSFPHILFTFFSSLSLLPSSPIHPLHTPNSLLPVHPHHLSLHPPRSRVVSRSS